MAPTHDTDVTDVPDPIGPPDATPAVEEKDVVRRFAERGEDALQRLADLPGGSRALRAVAELGRRVDEIARKARGIDALEQRVEALERELAELRRERA